jgi:hypothetical protein
MRSLLLMCFDFCFLFYDLLRVGDRVRLLFPL